MSIFAASLTACRTANDPRQAVEDPQSAIEDVSSTSPSVVSNPQSSTSGGQTLDDLASYCQNASASRHPELGRIWMNQLGAQLQDHASGRVPLDDVRLVRTHVDFTLQSIEHGELDQAFETLASLREIADAPEAVQGTQLLTGIAHMRAAEAENCFTASTGEVCVIGRLPEGVYAFPEHSREAVAAFTQYLQAQPNNTTIGWLLNILTMTLGTYPGGVPEQWRIPPEVFESEHETPRFRDVGRILGLADVDLLGGAVMEDLDSDGDLDVFTTSYNPCSHARYYENRGDGTFEDRSEAAGLSQQLGGFNVQQTDYDNDGLKDLFITRGAWQFDFGGQRNSLLHNDGQGRFTDVTHAAGLANPAYPTQASAWADYDGDGDLDLYIGNEASGQGAVYPAQLFRNEGDGTFADVAAAAGVQNLAMAKGVAWGDYDNDGDPDLYVSNTSANRLYRNDGSGTFTDVARSLSVDEPTGRSFAPWFFDYDNDGWLDIFVAGYDAQVDDVARDMLGQRGTGERPRLYHNDGPSGFTDVTERAGLDRVLLPMGSNFGDVDNDGWLDIYLGTGNPDPLAVMPNVLFWNDGGERFLDATSSAGVGHLPKGHGVSFGDVDNDGDQDIFLQAGGFVPGDPAPNALFENPGSDNTWVSLELMGSRSNRPAIGARVEIVTVGPSGKRSIYREVTSGSSFGANSLRLEVGLGDATAIETVSVRFPSGWSQRTGTLEVNHAYEIEEGVDEARQIQRAAIELLTE